MDVQVTWGWSSRGPFARTQTSNTRAPATDGVVLFHEGTRVLLTASRCAAVTLIRLTDRVGLKHPIRIRFGHTTTGLVPRTRIACPPDDFPRSRVVPSDKVSVRLGSRLPGVGGRVRAHDSYNSDQSACVVHRVHPSAFPKPA